MAKLKLTQQNYDALRDRLHDRVSMTGEEIKNDLPNIIRECHRSKVWEHFRDANGEPFKTLGDWLCCHYPHGAGMGHGDKAISWGEARMLCSHVPDVDRILSKNPPSKGKPGRPENNRGVNSPIVDRHCKGRTAVVLEARLAQEKPQFLQDFHDGKYKSITAAARAARLIPPVDRIAAAKCAVRKMTIQERQEFFQWIADGKWLE